MLRWLKTWKRSRKPINGLTGTPYDPNRQIGSLRVNIQFGCVVEHIPYDYEILSAYPDPNGRDIEVFFEFDPVNKDKRKSVTFRIYKLGDRVFYLTKYVASCQASNGTVYHIYTC